MRNRQLQTLLDDNDAKESLKSAINAMNTLCINYLEHLEGPAKAEFNQHINWFARPQNLTLLLMLKTKALEQNHNLDIQRYSQHHFVIKIPNTEDSSMHFQKLYYFHSALLNKVAKISEILDGILSLNETFTFTTFGDKLNNFFNLISKSDTATILRQPRDSFSTDKTSDGARLFNQLVKLYNCISQNYSNIVVPETEKEAEKMYLEKVNAICHAYQKHLTTKETTPRTQKKTALLEQFIDDIELAIGTQRNSASNSTAVSQVCSFITIKNKMIINDHNHSSVLNFFGMTTASERFWNAMELQQDIYTARVQNIRGVTMTNRVI